MTSQTVKGTVLPEKNTQQARSSASVDATEWYDYMDNLRALALLLGIFFHAALAYSPLMQNLWLAADPQNSVALDIVAWFSHMFRMPLFFVISGFFAAMLLQKRAIEGFMKNRSLRILMPFLIFLLPTLVAVIGGIVWASENVANPSPVLQFIKATMNNPDTPPQAFSTMHLWFLYNLFMFCCVTALLWKMKFFESRLASIMSSPWFLVVALPLLMIPALATKEAPLPAPERVYPELWSFGSYGLLFVSGLLIYRRQKVLTELARVMPLLLVASVGLYAYYYSELSSDQIIAVVMSGGYSFQWSDLPLTAIEAFVAVWMTIVCLVAGKVFLDRANPVLRVFAESSYWVYLVHLPILFFIQYLLLDVQLNMWLKFLIGSFGTLGVGMVSYYLLVKWTPLGWMLGVRRAAQPIR